jgi:uncharacterized protein with PQ loop repeat
MMNDVGALAPSAALLTWIFGAGTVALAVAVSIPQFLRLRRGGTAAGVSLTAAVNSSISFAAWTGYSLSIGDGWLIASSALGVPFALATAVAAWRCGADRSRLWVSAAWAAILLAAALLQETSGWAGLHIVIGASIAWQVLPATVHAYGSRDVSGIAAGSWWVLSTEGVLFLVYGLAGGEQAPVIYGVMAVLGSAAVLVRVRIGSRPRPQTRRAAVFSVRQTERPGYGRSRRGTFLTED